MQRPMEEKTVLISTGYLRTSSLHEFRKINRLGNLAGFHVLDGCVFGFEKPME